MGAEKTEEETYSLIYSSLKHPVRRKILRMLETKPLTFSEILEVVSIDSGHLTYHLEDLGDLITHSQNGKYQLSSVGSAAVRLMGGVEEHSLELSKPKLNLTRIFAKVYPLVVSAVLIIACLYFISYTTSFTNFANGVAGVTEVFHVPNLTVANSTTIANETAITFVANLTQGFVYGSVGNVSFASFAVANVTALNATSSNFTISWEQMVKPYLYYGIGGLIIGLVYPAVVLIEFIKNPGHKRKHRL